MQFEEIVHLNLAQKMPLRDAISMAVEKFPETHAEYIFRASNSIKTKPLNQWPEDDYPDFRTAIKSIRELENSTFTEAMNMCVCRYPELYNKYLKNLNGEEI